MTIPSRCCAVLDGRVEVVVGDITALDVEAIVNAANAALLPGGGVCGAIHRAAGPGLARECASLGGCDVGEAKITAGHGLRARRVIHAVGLPWPGGEPARTEPARRLMSSAYGRALELAHEHRLDSVAFPVLGIGIFGWPLEEGCAIAAETVVGFLRANAKPDRVLFAVLDLHVGETLCRALAVRDPDR